MVIPTVAWAFNVTGGPGTGGGPHKPVSTLKVRFSLLPLSRPASAWPMMPSIVFPTPDGKIISVGLWRQLKQNKHTE
ncbi:hypothetical protein LAD64_24205 [Klebsiella pneumoniae]|nr:hypothetical protein [Klebsiella pneumoniae]